MKNPKRAIPLSIIITLIIVAISYCGVSAVITLMMPYYMLDANTPFPTAYDYVGLEWAKYIVVVGAIASLATWFVYSPQDLYTSFMSNHQTMQI